jgi:hypothetical protein
MVDQQDTTSHAQASKAKEKLGQGSDNKSTRNIENAFNQTKKKG